MPAFGERVGPGVVPEGKATENAGRFEFSQTSGEHVRAHPQLTLQIAVASRPVEQLLHDQEGPPRPHDVEGRSQLAHAVGEASAFSQNGE